MEKRIQNDAGQSKEKLFKGNHWELSTDIGLLGPAQKEFEQRLMGAGWEEEDYYGMVVSFGEAFINAVAHGNLGLKEKGEHESWRDAALRVQKDNPSHKKVFIDLDITSEELSVTVRDEGEGFKHAPDPTDPEGLLKSSGRGLVFMRNFFDSVEYNEKGNEVTMKKRRNS